METMQHRTSLIMTHQMIMIQSTLWGCSIQFNLFCVRQIQEGS